MKRTFLFFHRDEDDHLYDVILDHGDGHPHALPLHADSLKEAEQQLACFLYGAPAELADDPHTRQLAWEWYRCEGIRLVRHVDWDAYTRRHMAVEA